MVVPTERHREGSRTVPLAGGGRARSPGQPLERVTVVKNNEPWRTLEGTSDADAGPDAYTAAGEWTDETPLTGMDWDDTRGTDGDVYTV